jgi:hypothetical protein
MKEVFRAEAYSLKLQWMGWEHVHHLLRWDRGATVREAEVLSVLSLYSLEVCIVAPELSIDWFICVFRSGLKSHTKTT